MAPRRHDAKAPPEFLFWVAGAVEVRAVASFEPPRNLMASWRRGAMTEEALEEL
jgi:hypothetical protein